MLYHMSLFGPPTTVTLRYVSMGMRLGWTGNETGVGWAGNERRVEWE